MCSTLLTEIKFHAYSSNDDKYLSKTGIGIFCMSCYLTISQWKMFSNMTILNIWDIKLLSVVKRDEILRWTHLLFAVKELKYKNCTWFKYFPFKENCNLL